MHERSDEVAERLIGGNVDIVINTVLTLGTFTPTLHRLVRLEVNIQDPVLIRRLPVHRIPTKEPVNHRVYKFAVVGLVVDVIVTVSDIPICHYTFSFAADAARTSPRFASAYEIHTNDHG